MIDGVRREYQSGELRRSQLADEPLDQFNRWLDEALSLELKDATAMALATASPDAVPSVRIVLLKACDADGFSFYTDYRSQKGQELSLNPVAAAVFHWRELDRQVRLTGSITKISPEISRDYFASRPLESRRAAAASTQSTEIADRQALESAVADVVANHPADSVPPPDEWGGYLLKPERYEFWQGREGRLHDRFRYSRSSSGWRIDRLQP